MGDKIDEELLNTPIGQHGKHIKLENLKHSWTKWGGGDNSGFQERTPEWNCQVCGIKQPEIIDPFLFPLSNIEFIRICPICQAKRIKLHIDNLSRLIKVCRKNRGNFFDLVSSIEEEFLSSLDNLLI